MRTPQFLFAALAVSIIACESNKPDQQYVPLSSVLPKSTAAGAAPVSGQPAGNANVRLNPKHGEPGHRCDIPDGAPLPEEGTPAANPAPAQSSTFFPEAAALKNGTVPSAIVPAPATASDKSAKSGLNPEHGQPGHRCDIAVGAPLNSKPVSTSSAPVVTTANTPATKVAPGMNPAHGEPGHRCDIAVGAPLASADKKDDAIQVKNVPVKDTNQ